MSCFFNLWCFKWLCSWSGIIRQAPRLILCFIKAAMLSKLKPSISIHSSTNYLVLNKSRLKDRFSFRCYSSYHHDISDWSTISINRTNFIKATFWKITFYLKMFKLYIEIINIIKNVYIFPVASNIPIHNQRKFATQLMPWKQHYTSIAA